MIQNKIINIVSLPHFTTIQTQSMKQQKIPGWNFLNNQGRAASQINLPDNFVIVDRNDWTQVITYLLENPEAFNVVCNPIPEEEK